MQKKNTLRRDEEHRTFPPMKSLKTFCIPDDNGNDLDLSLRERKKERKLRNTNS
jgi:hypothetical protein